MRYIVMLALACAVCGAWAAENQAQPVPPWEWRHGGAAKAKAEKTESGKKSCGSKHACGQMDSCEEARHYLSDCGQSNLDRDSDGIPCESLCK